MTSTLPETVFAAPPTVVVPVAGSSRVFPVRRIICVGRNYVEHAIEMGHTGREPPFFFLKPADTLVAVREGEVGRMHYPGATSSLHHEVELVVAIGQAGRDVPVERAMEHVWGYAVGLDMTRRDLQNEAKKQGRPWCTGKGFDESAPIGEVVPADRAAIGPDTEIRLDVNGGQRQRSTIGKLIWSVPEIIAHVSALWDLAPGDLIYTGTPEGVAAVVAGDRLDARIAGIGRLQVDIVPRAA
ncbi:MAG: fumarylacetoacetate hydrolase family protein [Ideonella sp.]|jgi:fumarylpyruvate hydrolase|nr:fumarylacetoacetate hydrolase family protein [Ideonella sp.]